MSQPLSSSEVTYEDFSRYFPWAPAALCIKECARLSALKDLSLRGPILDAGCGDGVFAKIAFRDREVWGVDIDPHEAQLARDSGAYTKVIVGDLTQEKLPNDYFHSCVANCSLEHIPRLDLALTRIFHSLVPGGTFVTFLPNEDWAKHLLSYRALERTGGHELAERLRRGVDAFFRHHHLYDAAGWTRMAEDAGFVVERVDPVLSTQTTVGFELFLLPSLVSWLNKKVTHRWTRFSEMRKMLSRPTYSLVQSAMRLGDEGRTAEFLLVARKPQP